jgi:hypothetical protein
MAAPVIITGGVAGQPQVNDCCDLCSRRFTANCTTCKAYICHGHSDTLGGSIYYPKCHTAKKAENERSALLADAQRRQDDESSQLKKRLIAGGVIIVGLIVVLIIVLVAK